MSSSFKLLALIIIFFAVPALAGRQSGKIVGRGTDKITIDLTDPRGGWTVDQMVVISGKVSDPTVDPILININGARYLLRTFSGQFKRKFPLTSGRNTIVVQAINKKGTFKVERSVYAKIPPTPIMVILTSDADGVYTDLHIYEPKTGLKDAFEESKDKNQHVYWADVSSLSGGKFYLNSQGGDFDQPGYGPYLYTHKSPPMGIYRIDANYWPSGDKAHTLGTLNVTLNGGKPDEVNRVIKAPLAKPGETVTLAWIRVDKGGKMYFYAPGLDKKPTSHEIWPAWVVDFVPKSNGDGGYEY